MENGIFSRGDLVEAKSFSGTLSRRVVRDEGRVVFICKEDEFAKAEAERREPGSMGFPKKDVQRAER